MNRLDVGKGPGKMIPDEIVRLIGITSTYLQDVLQCWIEIQQLKHQKGISEKQIIEMLLPGDRDFIAHALRLVDIPFVGCTKQEVESLK